jgi:hypothetical protein
MAHSVTRLSIAVCLVAIVAGAFAWRHATRGTQAVPSVLPTAALTRADSAAPSATAAPLPAALVQLLGKTIITAVFGLAALFVVLSRRFDSETRKWAFSVLTLIAGVWLGSA